MQKRMIGVFCLLCLLASLLVLRLGGIMLDPYYLEVGNQQSSQSLQQEISRGTIYDYNRSPITNRTNARMAAIVVTPENIVEVAQITDLTDEQLMERMKSGKPFLSGIKTKTTSATDANIIPFSYYQRYTSPKLAPHVVGHLSDGVGVSGIEKAYEDLLAGARKQIKITYQMDALGRPLPIKQAETNISGSGDGLVLTLDNQVQQIIQQAGADMQGGAIVVMEVQTGKLRGVASFPSYDQNAVADALQNPDSPMLNRAFTPLSVGSVFKVAMVAAALEQGVSPNFSYTCTGSYELAGTVMRCHNREGHGKQKLEEALHNSCNPYFINLGLQLDQTKLIATLRALSFGKQTELAPGLYSAAGTLPGKDLSIGALANLSFGQGTLLATPVQVAQMISAVANGGTTPTPSLVEGVVNEQRKWIDKSEQPLGLASISEKNASAIRSYMAAGNMLEQHLGTPEFTTAGGKTSTAQTGRFKQNGAEIHFGWYAGFLPAQTPKYAVVVVNEAVQSGNKDAAPIFASIADQLFLLGKLGNTP